MQPKSTRVNIEAHPALVWAIRQDGELQRYIGKFMADELAEHVAQLVVPPGHADQALAKILRRPAQLPTVRLRFRRIRHKTTGEVGCLVECVDDRGIEQLREWRAQVQRSLNQRAVLSS